MINCSPISQLYLLFILAITSGTLSGLELEPSVVEVTQDNAQDSEKTAIADTSMPVKIIELVPLEPELVDVSEIITLLEKEEFNRESLAQLPQEGKLSHFGGGSYLFINSSDMNIAILMDEIRFELKPSQGKVIYPSSKLNSGSCQVTLSYKLEQQWKVFRKTRWMTTRSYRSLIFFHQDPGSGQLIIKPVVDVLPYDPQKAE